MCIAIISACSQSEKASTPAPPAGRGASALSSPSGAVPEIASASLSPGNPTAATKLMAHYSLRNPGTGGISLSFRWFVDNRLMQESAVAELEPGQYGRGSEVYAEIVASNNFGAGRPVRTNVLTIDNSPPTVSSISLLPIDPPVGAIITATAVGEDLDDDTVTLTYQWYVNGKPVTDALKSNEFSTSGLRKKDLLFAVVAPMDGTIDGKDKESEIMVIANSAPQVTSTPPNVVQNGVYQYQVTAKDPDGDTLTYGLLKSPVGMTIDSSTGLIAWTVPEAVSEKQEVQLKISADDGDGGTAYQEYSFFLLPR